MPAPGIGAIVKAGAKSFAKEKAKSFITGKGKGKGGALQKTVDQKPTKVDPSNLMGRQVGGGGGGDIPASKQTINVTALGSDSPVGPSSGSGDIKIVQDISVAVSAIAESMKGGLVLKEKAQRKERLAAEKEKRAAKEAELEKPDESKKPDDDGGGKVKVPGVGLLSGIFGFLTKFIFGIAIMKLIDLANSPAVKGIISAIKVVGNFFTKILFPVAGGLLDGLISFIDLAYTITDGAEKVVKNIFGEEGAEKFRTFMENFKTLINSFVIFKIIKGKFGEAIARNIKNAFKLVKNFIKNSAKLVTKIFPQVGKVGSKLLTAGKGLLSKGVSKVGGFAAKIFGKASGVIAPAFKGAKPFLSKFFGKIPIVGPLVITIVSLLSGEPASQAIFKGLGAALGGALGTFIPIPFLGTLIGETIGVFVGDLLYELLMGGGIDAVGQKLKDTFMTLFKGGKAVVDWVGGGIKAFVNNVLSTDPFNVKSGFGIRAGLTKGIKAFGLYNFFESLGFTGGKDGQVDKFPNLLNILNPLKFFPLLFKSFFGKRDEGETVTNGGGTTAVVDEEQTTVNGGNADAVASETTYEGGEGNTTFIPIPVMKAQNQAYFDSTKNKGNGTKTQVKYVDDIELIMYGGK